MPKKISQTKQRLIEKALQEHPQLYDHQIGDLHRVSSSFVRVTRLRLQNQERPAAGLTHRQVLSMKWA